MYNQDIKVRYLESNEDYFKNAEWFCSGDFLIVDGKDNFKIVLKLEEIEYFEVIRHEISNS